MLFLIYEGGVLAGQVGFKDLTAKEAMMDNGMRGERTRNPKLMVYAHKTLARWLFKEAGVHHIIGWVVADNIPGIMMNKQIGWGEWLRYPLNRVDTIDGTAWQIGDERQESANNKYCFKLIMKNLT